MKDEIVKIVNEFTLGKQEYFLTIQYLDNICMIESYIKKISLTLSDDDYWTEPYLYGDYRIIEDNGTLAWNVQFNSAVIEERNLRDLLKVMNDIFLGKKIMEPENILRPMHPDGNYLLKGTLQ